MYVQLESPKIRKYQMEGKDRKNIQEMMVNSFPKWMKLETHSTCISITCKHKKYQEKYSRNETATFSKLVKEDIQAA